MTETKSEAALPYFQEHYKKTPWRRLWREGADISARAVFFMALLSPALNLVDLGIALTGFIFQIWLAIKDYVTGRTSNK